MYGQKKRVATSVANPLKCLVRPERFELPTYWFVASCSIQLSHGRTARKLIVLLSENVKTFFAGRVIFLRKAVKRPGWGAGPGAAALLRQPSGKRENSASRLLTGTGRCFNLLPL